MHSRRPRKNRRPSLIDSLESRLLFTAAGPQLGFYLQTNLAVAANVTAAESLIATAAAAGYSFMIVSDTKLSYDGTLRPNEQNPNFDPTWSYYTNTANLLAYAAAHNITVIPGSFEVGRADWIATNINENYLEGQSVIGANFTVNAAGTALVFNPTNPTLVNTSFASGSTGWSLDAGRASIDTTTGRTDSASLKISAGGGRGFGIQTITVQPHQEYQVSYWVKEDTTFSGNSSNEQLVKIYDPSQGIYDEHHEDDPALAYNPSIGGWQQMTYMFNSGTSTSVQLRMGSWGSTTGNLWYDDVSVTQTALVNVVRNASAPVKIYRPNGTLLTEGVDTSNIQAPYTAAVTGVTYGAWSTPLTVTIPAGSALKPGDQVKIDYSGVQPIYDGQYAVTLSDPAVQTYYKNVFTQIRKMYSVGTPVMLDGYDEIRAGNSEPGETGSAATLLDNSFNATYNNIRAVDPTTPIYTWSDMFDPYHNAVNGYYLWNGNLTGDAAALPKDVTILNWNLGDLNQSLEYFGNTMGLSQIIAGYYDTGNGATAAASEVQAAVGAAGVKGLMYTTWNNDYSQLVNYANSAKAAWAQYITPPTVNAVYVRGTTWTSSYLNSLVTAGQGDATLGYKIPTGANQLKTLPWSNLNQISITFSENVTIAQASLALTGLNVASYAINSFLYNSTTHTATWTLTNNIGNDMLQISLPATGANAVTDTATNPLDGEWTDGASTTSGNGVPGGNFVYHLKVLPGDLNGSGTVDLTDLTTLSGNWQHSASASGGDLNGDGFVDLTDLTILSGNWQSSSPTSLAAAMTPTTTPPNPTPTITTKTRNNPLTTRTAKWRH